MKKKTINFFLLIVLCQYVNAQSTFKPGYLVTAEKDTINGFILNKIDSELAYNINFKKTLADETAVDYTTNELLGFGFSTGRIFERMLYVTKSEATKDTSYVFAKRLIKGKIDFYVWRHSKINSKDFFLVNNESEKKAHIKKPTKNKINVDGKTYNKSDNKYKRDLVYVKNDKSQDSQYNNNLKYGEKPIGKDIIAFNTNFQEDYPMEKYQEPIEYKYTILAGTPFRLNSEELHFRVGVYRDKTFVEKTNKLSFVAAVVYHHWSEDEIWDKKYQNGTSNYRWQMLNVIPFGIRFQSNSKKIIPYAYAGVGAAVLMKTDYVIKNYENIGSEKDFVFVPTVNVGVGLKYKVKSNYILTEVTPTINGLFFNVGYSF